MSANVYTVQSLLVGTKYNSRTLSGEIVSAEPHPKGIWYDGADAYLVEVRDSLRGGYTFRTVAVKVGE